MDDVFIAVTAIFLQFHAVRVSFFIFVRRVIPALAIGAGQSDNYPHDAHLLRPSCLSHIIFPCGT